MAVLSTQLQPLVAVDLRGEGGGGDRSLLSLREAIRTKIREAVSPNATTATTQRIDIREP
jgi:hypothetical protein